jgi:hypothetical protein
MARRTCTRWRSRAGGRRSRSGAAPPGGRVPDGGRGGRTPAHPTAGRTAGGDGEVRCPDETPATNLFLAARHRMGRPTGSGTTPGPRDGPVFSHGLTISQGCVMPPARSLRRQGFGAVRIPSRAPGHCMLRSNTTSGDQTRRALSRLSPVGRNADGAFEARITPEIIARTASEHSGKTALNEIAASRRGHGVARSLASTVRAVLR